MYIFDAAITADHLQSLKPQVVEARSTREIERLSSQLRATSSALTAERSMAIQDTPGFR